MDPPCRLGCNTLAVHSFGSDSLDSGYTLFWFSVILLDLVPWTLDGHSFGSQSFFWFSIILSALVLGLWVFCSWSWILVDGSVVVVTLLDPGFWTLDLVTLLDSFWQYTHCGVPGHWDSGTATRNEALGDLALQFSFTIFWQLRWPAVGLFKKKKNWIAQKKKLNTQKKSDKISGSRPTLFLLQHTHCFLSYLVS